jgi:PAS domain S-box-containing protein
MENLPDSIYFKDTDSRFLRASHGLAEKFGLRDPAEARGKTDFDFFTEEHARQAREDEERLMQSGQVLLNKEEKETWPDGSTTWVSTTKLPLHDRAGKLIGTFGISRDITDQKRAEEAMRAARDAAEAASRAKSDFLANMSHEIRTPMNAIIGMTELVLDTPLSRTQREYLTTVWESGESLLSILNDILDFSKIEAGKLDLDLIDFSLRECLGDTMKSLALRAHRKGLELAYHVAPDVPDWIAGDPGRLRQVIVNLVGNAIKFTETGEVVLDVALERPPPEAFELKFRVRDTGIGIPENKLTAIFEAFEQADTSMTRRFGGTGLGLAISSKLVALMGGRIWAESTPGQGSTFHFLARFQLPRTEPVTPRAVQHASIGGARVLVVDDNATNRTILDEMLRNWDMKPEVVAGVAEALQAMREARERQQPFDLILTDVHMPDVDGFELAAAIKNDPQLAGTVIMMLTSADRPGDITRCEQLGAAAYLMKPIKQSELFDAIVSALGVSAPDDGAQTTPEQRRAARPLRILLAEDSLPNQKLAVGVLEKWGHLVTVANNGLEALAALDRDEFDLVLMDVQMPEMDGLEAAAAIRARERQTGAHVPIIAMTAHAMKGDRERCLESGMDGYIPKPVRARKLFEAIEAVLGEVQPAAEQAAGETAPGGVDWTIALSAVDGDRDLLKDVLEAFLIETPGLLEKIEESIRAGDAATLKRAAHTLKGSLRTLGAAAGEHAARLETLGREGDLGRAEAELAPLRSAMERVIADVREFVGDVQTTETGRES